jgi:hypothetical protein
MSSAGAPVARAARRTRRRRLNARRIGLGEWVSQCLHGVRATGRRTGRGAADWASSRARVHDGRRQQMHMQRRRLRFTASRALMFAAETGSSKNINGPTPRVVAQAAMGLGPPLLVDRSMMNCACHTRSSLDNELAADDFSPAQLPVHIPRARLRNW